MSLARVSLASFESAVAHYDACVSRSSVPDRACSHSAWILSAREAFQPEEDPVIYASELGYVPLLRYERGGADTLAPFELQWGFCSALIGPDPLALVDAFVEVLRGPELAWDRLILTGLVRDSNVFRALLLAFRKTHRLGLSNPTRRCVASLQGGFDGWMSRRGAHFRKHMRQLMRSVRPRFEFQTLDDITPAQCAPLWQRILDVESRSWKGIADDGLRHEGMAMFYRVMMPRLAEQRALRLTFARDAQGRDVGFILGSVQDASYRGLQMSFDDAFRKDGLGNLLQLETIRSLCETGEVVDYDLGGEMEYKAAWSETMVETVALFVESPHLVG